MLLQVVPSLLLPQAGAKSSTHYLVRVVRCLVEESVSLRLYPESHAERQ
jgi:hypothetical protein